MKDHHSIQTLCITFSVSVSGYYGWRSRLTAPGPRAHETQALTQSIKAIHAQSRQTYGSPRIQIELRKTGARHGRNRIARLMQMEGITVLEVTKPDTGDRRRRARARFLRRPPDEGRQPPRHAPGRHRPRPRQLEYGRIA